MRVKTFAKVAHLVGTACGGTPILRVKTFAKVAHLIGTDSGVAPHSAKSTKKSTVTQNYGGHLAEKEGFEPY